MVKNNAGGRPTPRGSEKNNGMCSASLCFSDSCGAAAPAGLAFAQTALTAASSTQAVVWGMEMQREWPKQAPNYPPAPLSRLPMSRPRGRRSPPPGQPHPQAGGVLFARVPFNGAAVYPVHAITAGLASWAPSGGGGPRVRATPAFPA